MGTLVKRNFNDKIWVKLTKPGFERYMARNPGGELYTIIMEKIFSVGGFIPMQHHQFVRYFGGPEAVNLDQYCEMIYLVEEEDQDYAGEIGILRFDDLAKGE